MGREGWLLLLALVALLFLVYQPAWRGSVLWDDDGHIIKPELRSLEGLWHIWFDLQATRQYSPLLHSFFWLQYQLWGEATLGYHLLNIALHGAAAVLVAMVLRRLKVPGAYLAAAIFALHPVQVESVAWITEQKNTLSTVFYLSAALMYLRFDQTRTSGATTNLWSVPGLSSSAGSTVGQANRGTQQSYAVALALFVLGLLSKTVTATLPAALLVVFWWQRGRLSWRRDVLPLGPFFVLGVAAGLLTAWAEWKLIGAEGAEYDFTLVERFLIAGRVIWFYLGKLFWPAELIFIYPRWTISQTVWWQYLFPAGAGALLTALWAIRHRARGPLAAMLFFVGTLFPVLGFFNVYPFRYALVADHFQYLPSLGIITLTAAGAALLLKRVRPWAKAVGYALCLVMVLALAYQSRQQSEMFVNLETLYRETIQRNPASEMVHNNLAVVLVDAGKIGEGIEHYREALRLKPNYANAHYNLGNALVYAGRIHEAIAHYVETLRLRPDYAQAHNNLGNALASCGDVNGAVAHFRRALRLNPKNAAAWNNLGNVLGRMGQPDEAIQSYRRALLLKPDRAEFHNNLGLALARLSKTKEAIEHFREALRLKPTYVAARGNLADALATLGESREAIEHYNQLVSLTPDAVNFVNSLAWLLAISEDAQGGDSERAVRLAQRARELSGEENAECLDTLAAAYAAAGRFADAVLTAERAVELAESAGQSSQAQRMRARLELYRAGHPFRDSRRPE